jgi:hypothetical protein
MGKRQDQSGNNQDFQFPDQTQGYVTSCWSNWNGPITKTVWRDANGKADSGGPINLVQVTFPYPHFEDPPCRWRIQLGQNSFSDKMTPTDANGAMFDNDQIPNFAEITTPPQDRQSPSNCNTFSNYLNTFQYRDCLQTASVTDANGNTFTVCARWDNRYVCSNAPRSPQPTDNWPPTTGRPNSFACTGQQCRCQQDGGFSVGASSTCLRDPDGDPYYSFYRQYIGSFQRQTIPTDHDNQQHQGPNDDAVRRNVPVACYGFYNEFDPMTHQTQREDKRCVIDIDVSHMKTTQLGKAEFGQNANTQDVDPEAKDNQRPPSGNGSNTGNLWFTKLGWAFSFLDESTFQNATYNQDLTNVFLSSDTIDKAVVTTSWPVANQDEDPRPAISDYLRSFDDSAGKRIVSNWWQAQATAVATIVHPPAVRLILPPGYAFGADATNPIFGQVASSSSSSGMDSRSQRMEVQIGATEDLLGEVVAALQKSLLLHLEEEPIHVAVAFGDPADFRAKAVAWCAWYIKQSGATSCDTASGKIGDYIKGLNAYADDIEKSRVLRTDLALYAGALLQLEQKLTQPISTWMSQNIDRYKNYLSQAQQLAQAVTMGWADAEQAMSTFHDKTNMPWCMNQRYEGPIFSLLDPWLPSRNANGRISADGLPDLGGVTRPQDILIDFSHIAYLTGSLKLPVLDPVQVTVNVPAPDDSVTLDSFSLTLPPLPSLDPIQTAIQNSIQSLPKVQGNSNFPPLQLPTIDQGVVQQAVATVQQIRNVIKGPDDSSPSMNKTYGAFWKSIGPLAPCKSDSDCEEGNGEQCVNGSCQSQYDPNKHCSDETLKNKKERGECCDFNDSVCQNVEMDLLERFQRIGSRKLVLLNEDYQSLGIRKLTPSTCIPSDESCYILHNESPQPLYQWQINPPSSAADTVGIVKKAVWNATMPQPIGNLSSSSVPYDTNDLVPMQDGPPPLNLSPRSSSPSS